MSAEAHRHHYQCHYCYCRLLVSKTDKSHEAAVIVTGSPRLLLRKPSKPSHATHAQMQPFTRH